MEVKLLSIILLSMTILSCSDTSVTNNQEKNNYDHGGMPSKDQEFFSFLGEAVAMGERQIPEQRQSTIKALEENPAENYPVIPKSVRISDDGRGLHFSHEIYTANLAKSQIDAIVNIIDYKGESFSAEIYCQPEFIDMMRDFEFHVVEDIYLHSDIVKVNNYNLETCSDKSNLM